MGFDNLEDSTFKIAFGNTSCVVDLLVLCREKLRKRYFDINYFCQLAILDIGFHALGPIISSHFDY